jgi:RNA polymerase sigma factor (sigma-70 family)
VLRQLGPVVLGAVVRRYGDFAASEDAVQEALLAAHVQWPSEGLPTNPRGWLFQVACRRMTDLIREEHARRRREAAYAEQAPAAGEPSTPIADAAPADLDDTLLLLFMCSHPALAAPSAIALTLRAVGGLTTAEIASAFLVPEATVAQRISRAKQRIRESGIPFSMPTERERAGRLASVLHVLYLIFNEGYTSSTGPILNRVDLSNEAIRLARGVCRLLPDDAEAAGLLSLMLLTDARRPARTGPGGELIPLADQNRSHWNRSLIEEGLAILTQALRRGSVGQYQLQAAIAVLHDEAASAPETDWPQILTLYGLLMRVSDNPMVALNRAIAKAMVDGPRAGLDLLCEIDAEGGLAGHYRLDAVRAHLHEMAGDDQTAKAHYLAAAARTTSLPEINYLLTRAARLVASGPPPGAASADDAQGRT